MIWHNATQTDQETETKEKTLIAPTWNVIVHDDPVTLMSYVTQIFRKVFGYSETKAQSLMMEVHSSGRSLVWTGAREQAETYVHKLHAYHPLATLEQVSG